ncbi:hypothetical protein LSH36_436g04006 [Paralvinella palmiformis]|uniref:Uncharacterized protein n=1 Tax=Paralvinella palmiformis TaxID=53620 RepID=A0AAD9MZU5_9ANNE|nr:hypothetical protein LSH36_436g04006 [Paralvinella palmiformis]
MEEYRKHLPLRQQTSKPMLKYSGATTGMPYYQVTAPSSGYVVQSKPPSDMGTAQVESSSRMYRGSYSCLTNDGMLSSVFGAHYSIQPQPPAPQQSYAGYLYMSGPGAPNGVTPAQILAASIQTSTNIGNKNPYAQPISVQELAAPPDSSYKSGAVPLGSTSGSSVSSNSSNRSNNDPSPTSASIQTNSFMRPQSAVVTESNVITRKTTTTARSAGTVKQEEKVESTSCTVTSTCKTTHLPRSNSHEFLKTQPAPRPPSTIKPGSSPNSGYERNSVRQSQEESSTQGMKKSQTAPSTATIKSQIEKHSAPPTPQIVLFKPPNGQTTPNLKKPSPVNRFTDRFSRPGSGKENVSNDSRSKVSSTHQGDGRSSSNASGKNEQSGRTSPAIGAYSIGASELKVRNPNYNPNKPYSEVSDPDHLDTDQSKSRESNDNVDVGKRQDPVSHRSKSALTLNNHNSHEVTTTKPPIPTKKADTVHLRNGDSRRMPVTNTMTGTVFYRKGSKAEAVIHDLKRRPRADGAPAKPMRAERQRIKDGAEESGNEGGRQTEEEGTK